jgi:HAMP domain-containing protein
MAMLVVALVAVCGMVLAWWVNRRAARCAHCGKDFAAGVMKGRPICWICVRALAGDIEEFEGTYGRRGE